MRAWNKFYLWRPGSVLRAWLFTSCTTSSSIRGARYEIEQAMEELPAVAVRATQGEQLETGGRRPCVALALDGAARSRSARRGLNSLHTNK